MLDLRARIKEHQFFFFYLAEFQINGTSILLMTIRILDEDKK